MHVDKSVSQIRACIRKSLTPNMADLVDFGGRIAGYSMLDQDRLDILSLIDVALDEASEAHPGVDEWYLSLSRPVIIGPHRADRIRAVYTAREVDCDGSYPATLTLWLATDDDDVSLPIGELRLSEQFTVRPADAMRAGRAVWRDGVVAGVKAAKEATEA